MNSPEKNYYVGATLILSTVVCLLLNTHDAFASEELTPGRRLWDNIMLWVNFGILVVLFIKFARKPLMNYLRGIKEKIKNEIDVNENQLDEVNALMDEEANKLKNMDKRIEEIRQSAIEIGKREKEKTIEQAKIAAKKMIKDAEIYAGYRMAMAKKTLSDQMVEIAISLVEDRLMEGLSEEDNEKTINQFVSGLEDVKRPVT